MKKIFTLIATLLLSICLFAQAPQKMNYQAVVRNASNSLVANQNVSVRISILQGSATGAAVYSETHNVQTNANGLMTLEIGGGSVANGSFIAIDWANGPYFIKSEIDPEGGINYNVTTTQQLLSVPYALYAATSGNGEGPQGPAGPQGPQGEQGPAGPQGVPGQNGVSPSVTTTTTSTGTFVVVTDADGTHQFFVANGADGATGAQGPQGPAGQDGAIGPQGPQGVPGIAGISPSVSTTTTSNGTFVVITDANGTNQFFVPNGIEGATGPQGPQGSQGESGISPTVSIQALANGNRVIITSATSIDTFVVLNGAQGPQGETGPAGVGIPQMLSISGNQISISDGNSIDLPIGFDGNYNSLTNKPNLATVATTGSYNDLTNTPMIPDVANDATLTLQKNGTTIGSFTANASSDENINISVPTSTNELTNNSGYVSNTNCPTISFCDLYNAISSLQDVVSSLQNTVTSQQNLIDSLLNNSLTHTVPSVITTNVSSVTESSALCGGNVVSDGGSVVISRGICWSTTINPTIEDNYIALGYGIGQFSNTLSGLLSGTTYYIRAYAVNSTGVAYGANVNFTTNSSYLPWDGTGRNPNDALPCKGAQTISDYDGNVYNTVQLGNQCWMKENMRTTHYSDGTSIPMGLYGSGSLDIGYRYNPNNDSDTAVYGYLYNWKALMRDSQTSNAVPSGVQGICPQGWHVPSDEEWTLLTDYVSSQMEYQCENHSAEARALASSFGWNNSTNLCTVGNNQNNNNTTGFSAFPAGRYDGILVEYGSHAHFWTATEKNNNSAFDRYIYFDFENVSRHNNGNGSGKNSGFSVRCLRDSVINYNHQDCQTFYFEERDTIESSQLPYLWRGKSLTAAGTYFDSLQTAQGCDSIYTLSLLILGTIGNGQPCPNTPTVSDHEGNVYNTVLIGNQCWTKENIRTTTSPSTGTYLVNSTNLTLSGKTARWRHNDSVNCIAHNYGLLYNWYAAVDTFRIEYGENELGVTTGNVETHLFDFSENRRGICPKGWHLPNRQEWLNLKNYILSNESFVCAEDNTYYGISLLAQPSQSTSSCEYDKTGFSALYGGFYYLSNGGNFSNDGNKLSLFWSSTDAYIDGDAAYICNISETNIGDFNFYFDHNNKTSCFSVRCLRD